MAGKNPKVPALTSLSHSAADFGSLVFLFQENKAAYYQPAVVCAICCGMNLDP
jgi:hypothetical protein